MQVVNEIGMEWELVRDVAVNVVVVGGTVAALTLAVLRGVVRADMASLFGSGLAVLAGMAVVNGRRDLLPWASTDPGWYRLLPASATAVIVEVAARWPKLPETARTAFRVLGAAAIAWFVLPRELWTDSLLVAIVYVLSLIGTWVLWACFADRMPGGLVSLLLAVVAAGGAVVLIHAHSARFTDLMLMLLAGLVGCAIVAWPRRFNDGTAVPIAAVFLPGLMVAGQTETFSDVPTVSFLLVAASPLGAVIALLPPIRRWEGVRWIVAVTIAVIFPVIAGAILASRAESLSVGY